MAEVSPTPRLKEMLKKYRIGNYSKAFVDYNFCSTDDFYDTEKEDQSQIITNLEINQCDVPNVRRMWNKIRRTPRNAAKSIKSEKNIIDISDSPIPPKKENDVQCIGKIDKHYKKTLTDFGQSPDYKINQKVQFFIPHLIDSGEYINRMGVVKATYGNDRYDILDVERDRMYTVHWHFICNAQKRIFLNGSNNFDCLANDDASASASIAGSETHAFHSFDLNHCVEAKQSEYKREKIKKKVRIKRPKRRKLKKGMWSPNEVDDLAKLVKENPFTDDFNSGTAYYEFIAAKFNKNGFRRSPGAIGARINRFHKDVIRINECHNDDISSASDSESDKNEDEDQKHKELKIQPLVAEVQGIECIGQSNVRQMQPHFVTNETGNQHKRRRLNENNK